MDIYKALFYIYTSSTNLSEFIKKISAEVDNPIAIINKNFQIVASSDSNLYKDTFWDASIANGFWNLEAAHIIEEEFKDGGNFKIISKIGEHRRLFIKLIYNNVYVGYAAILEVNSNVDNLNLNDELLKAISILISKSLYEYKVDKLNDSDNLFLFNLLNNGYEDRKLYLEKIKETSIDFKKPLHLLLISNSTIAKEKKNSFTNEMKSLFKNSISILKDEYLIFLINYELDENVIRTLNDKLFMNKTNAIVTYKILDLFNIGSDYKTLIKLFTYLKNNDDEYKLFDEKDYLIILPYLENKAKDLNSYIDENIRAIYFYDSTNKTKFIDTLYMYLLTNNSLLETSKRLYVHRNTINYRLEKLQNEYNIDLYDYNKKLTYLNSISLLYYLSNSINKIEI